MKSDKLNNGVDWAPRRSLLHALGMTNEEIAQPLIGIVSSYNEIVPGHMNIDKIVDAVKQGVAMAGGTPVVFPAIAVCDGIAMGHEGMKYSLVTRDLIADSTEAMAMAHGLDALVMVPNCDKNVPCLWLLLVLIFQLSLSVAVLCLLVLLMVAREAFQVCLRLLALIMPEKSPLKSLKSLKIKSVQPVALAQVCTQLTL